MAQLLHDPEVEWFEQQRELHRVKRDYQPLVEDEDYIQHFSTNQNERKKRQIIAGSGVDTSLIWDEIFRELSLQEDKQHEIIRRNGLQFTDPMFSSQWFINGGGRDGADMNVKPAWDKGYTGKGVVVSILDDGI